MTFAPRTWVVGEVVSAALMNQEIRDQLNSMFDPWTTYTPTWTASSNPAIGNGSLTGRYIKIGRRCLVSIKLTMGSTTTYGSGGYSFGLPFTAAAGVDYLGTARLVAANAWNGQVVMSASSAAFNCTFPASSTDTRSATLAATVPETLANTHVVRAQVEYQTAS
ncbi:hypothetical protein ACIRPU_12625 [Streptomyces sp. NPDC102259]|uniref:hypothetical protein n=1 Tax=Streptomyces sp. NPDC102259 TaxID=3366148 RepID=UPI0038255B85